MLRKHTRWTGEIDLSSHLLFVDIPSSPSTMTVYIESARSNLWFTLRAHTSGRRLPVLRIGAGRRRYVSRAGDAGYQSRDVAFIPRFTEASLPRRFQRWRYISKAREWGYGIISMLFEFLSPPKFRHPKQVDATRTPLMITGRIESSLPGLSIEYIVSKPSSRTPALAGTLRNGFHSHASRRFAEFKLVILVLETCLYHRSQ
ncbi:hypothetical protein SCHPADRAFT_989697 [Schizopora paradoxa]|uniref:Uncharacterized protein n=1 Tax=Schizopora paradoxa TaxID=27342 RepID=A0A0H2R4Q4_9AGAM|nr:hypothetical protein SCHPADRAFT_989697 [Schizopora paradoxa]